MQRRMDWTKWREIGKERGEERSGEDRSEEKRRGDECSRERRKERGGRRGEEMSAVEREGRRERGGEERRGEESCGGPLFFGPAQECADGCALGCVPKRALQHPALWRLLQHRHGSSGAALGVLHIRLI